MLARLPNQNYLHVHRFLFVSFQGYLPLQLVYVTALEQDIDSSTSAEKAYTLLRTQGFIEVSGHNLHNFRAALKRGIYQSESPFCS